MGDIERKLDAILDRLDRMSIEGVPIRNRTPEEALTLAIEESGIVTHCPPQHCGRGGAAASGCHHGRDVDLSRHP